jgi:hypothetical protein
MVCTPSLFLWQIFATSWQMFLEKILDKSVLQYSFHQLSGFLQNPPSFYTHRIEKNTHAPNYLNAMPHHD